MQKAENMKRMYKNTLNNSIGRDKKVHDSRIHRRVALGVSFLTLLLTFSASSLIGCSKNFKNDLNNGGETIAEESEKYYGYSITEISLYEQSRLKKLLEEYNLTDYTQNGIERRNYNYTADDYKKIKELDETYLGGAYALFNKKSLDELCKALGYADFNDFLEKKYGGAIKDWAEYDLDQMSEIMKNELETLNKGSR